MGGHLEHDTEDDGHTLQMFDEGQESIPQGEQENVLENIRLHKEVIQSIKVQSLPIEKKLKLVRQVRTSFLQLTKAS